MATYLSAQDAYAVCPYRRPSCRSTPPEERCRQIRCGVDSPDVKTLVVSFADRRERDAHSAAYCHDIKEFSKCPVFCAIYRIESQGGTVECPVSRKNGVRSDFDGEIDQLYRKQN